MVVHDSFVQRLRVGLGILVGATLLGLVVVVAAERRVGAALERSQEALSLLEDAKELQIQLGSARAAEREFLLEDLRTPNFFQAGQSPALERHARSVEALERMLERLAAHDAEALHVAQMSEAVSAYARGFQELVQLQLERGSVYSGTRGRMREARFAMRDLVEELPEPARSALRTELYAMWGEEAAYLNDNDNRPRYLVGQRIQILDEELAALGLEPEAEMRAQVAAYRGAWERLLEIDDRVGRASGVGVRGELRQAQETIVPLASGAVERARTGFEAAHEAVHAASATARAVSAGAALAAVVLGAFLAVSLGRRLREPLSVLLGAVDRYAGGDRSARVGRLPHRDEFAVVGEAFDHMAETVAETAEELEEINASLELAVKGDQKALLERIKSLVAERKPPTEV